jgi:hypothetical protein
MEKKTDNEQLSEFVSEHFEFFHNSNWCPLFGYVPPPEYNPRSQAYQCYEVIQHARFLWGAGECVSLESYPESLLKTARTILACHDSTTQHMATGVCITEYGFADNQTLFSNWQLAVDFVRGFHWGMYFDNDLRYENDYLILAAFAIAEAKHALEAILSGEKEESPSVIDQVQVAQRLLSEAKTHYEVKRIQGKGGRRKAENKKKLYLELKEHKERIALKYPDASDLDVAGMIYEERCSLGKRKPGPERIRKILKKTSK